MQIWYHKGAGTKMCKYLVGVTHKFLEYVVLWKNIFLQYKINNTYFCSIKTRWYNIKKDNSINKQSFEISFQL